MKKLFQKMCDFLKDFDRVAFLIFTGFYVAFWGTVFIAVPKELSRIHTIHEILLLVLACILFGIFFKQHANAFVLGFFTGHILLAICGAVFKTMSRFFSYLPFLFLSLLIFLIICSFFFALGSMIRKIFDTIFKQLKNLVSKKNS